MTALMKKLKSTSSFSSNSTLHGGKYPRCSRYASYKHSIRISIFFFYYSGHCKKLDPEYKAAAEELGKREPPLYLAKVDATEQKGLAERFAVQGFPTLFFFK
jgi:thiol-disulfide isomerase/thioredoxin